MLAHSFKKAGSLILVTGEFSHLALFAQVAMRENLDMFSVVYAL